MWLASQGDSLIKQRNKISTIQILSQIVNGIKKSTSLEVFFNTMKEKNATAVCIQEA